MSRLWRKKATDTSLSRAVDYVRKAAWVVQEWQERQLQKHDPQTVLPLLTAERIRRATQLNIPPFLASMRVMAGYSRFS